MGEKVREWAVRVSTMARVARRHLQAAYAGLYNSLYEEWDFVQSATQGLGDDFQTADKALS